MTSLRTQRCYHHAQREAVARCPSCERYYCRECITEHEGRMLCATCLAALPAPARASRRFLRAVTVPAALLVGLAAAWLFFYALGAMLVRVPSSFHEGRPVQWLENPDA